MLLQTFSAVDHLRMRSSTSRCTVASSLSLTAISSFLLFAASWHYLGSSGGVSVGACCVQHAHAHAHSTSGSLIPINEPRYGAGNILVGFMSAAVIAKAMNRTLCLANFPIPPFRHRFASRSKSNYGSRFEEIYNISVLSSFVDTSSHEECMDACHGKMEVLLSLYGIHEDTRVQWTNNRTRQYNFNNQANTWSSIDDLRHKFHGYHNSCVLIGGLFPGLRWRGAFLAAAAYMDHSDPIKMAARGLVESAFGSSNVRYLAVHWRFRESHCPDSVVGRCFLRCAGGAHAALVEQLSPDPAWNATVCPKGAEMMVIVQTEGIFHAIRDEARALNVTNVYLSSDGWIRTNGCSVLAGVVNSLREEGLSVAGLWKCSGLSAFPEGRGPPSPVDIGRMMGLQDDQQDVGNRVMSRVEQEICLQSAMFVGSAFSSWSLAVQRRRMAQSRKVKLEEAGATREEIIDALLKDDFSAGLVCVNLLKPFAGHKLEPNETVSDDEGSNKWLDVLACESEVAKGGVCEIGVCN